MFLSRLLKSFVFAVLAVLGQCTLPGFLATEMPDRLGWLFIPVLFGGGGGGSAGPAGPLNGQVSGLIGHGLALSVNDSAPILQHRDGDIAATSLAGAGAKIEILSQPVRPAQQCDVRGGAGDVTIECDDDIAPELKGVAVLGPTTIRLFFNRYMNSASLVRADAYIVADYLSGVCTDNSYFTNSAPTPDFTILRAEAGENYADLFLSAPLQIGSRYTVIGNRDVLHDRAATPNYLSCSQSIPFEFPGTPRLLEARCPGSSSEILLTFSRPFTVGMNTAGSATCEGVECQTRFRISTDLGEVSAVRPPDGNVCAGHPVDTSGTRFCLTHSQSQGAETYSVIAANNANGDGFDFAPGLRSDGGIYLMSSPGDRATFIGCGQSPAEDSAFTFTGEDIFADGAAAGQVTGFQDRLLVGPGARGNLFLSHRPVDSLSQFLFFRIQRDLENGGGTHGVHENTDSFEYQTLGFPGCTPSEGNPLLGCGPHNEDGPGILTSETIAGREYILFSGRKSGGNSDYVYYADAASGMAHFRYTDYSYLLNTEPDAPINDNRVIESLEVVNGILFAIYPGGDSNRPYMVRVNGYGGEITPGEQGSFMEISYAPGFGARSATKPALADRLGGTIGDFNSHIYLANTGSVWHASGYDSCPAGMSAPDCRNDGGLLRSTNGAPEACDRASGICSGWIDVTPSANRFTDYFSIIPDDVSNPAGLVPGLRPFPDTAAMGGRFYMIRNACLVNMVAPGGPDTNCPVGQEVPQIWRCDPALSGPTQTCDPGDWNLVAEFAGSGRSNMGDLNNRRISLLIAGQNRLYVGFDNAVSGVQVWRTREGVTVAEGIADFEPAAEFGFGLPARNSILSRARTADNRVFITVGRDAGSFSVHELP